MVAYVAAVKDGSLRQPAARLVGLQHRPIRLLMQVIHTIAEAAPGARPLLTAPAFVPTMGNLHDGHPSPIRHAAARRRHGRQHLRQLLQFLPHEDFDSYPRTLEADCARLEAIMRHRVRAVGKGALPAAADLRVHAPAALGDILEGHFRPGFFTGVSTVVMKLFQIVSARGPGPRHAVFGKKDYQQLMVIRQLVQQFALPVTVHGVDTERAESGLALSSRNGYLSDAEREGGCSLPRAQDPDAAVLGGEHNLAALEQHAMQALARAAGSPTT